MNTPSSRKEKRTVADIEIVNFVTYFLFLSVRFFLFKLKIRKMFRFRRKAWGNRDAVRAKRMPRLPEAFDVESEITICEERFWFSGQPLLGFAFGLVDLVSKEKRERERKGLFYLNGIRGKKGCWSALFLNATIRFTYFVNYEQATRERELLKGEWKQREREKRKEQKRGEGFALHRFFYWFSFIFCYFFR